jgi:CheY-like chemotaxis protein
MAHILVVDDDAAIRDLIKDVLTAPGRTFAMASSGSEALALVVKSRFDLVILDRNMPRMGGLEVLRTLRASPATAKLKVLICTAGEMLSEVEESFAAGANDYIVKPLDFEKLKAKVSYHTRPV